MVYPKYLKRTLDVVIAASLLIVASPLLACAIVLLWLANSGKPFFFQQRPGLHGMPFTLYKLKTMNDAKDDNGRLLPDGERLTSIGRIVRKTSLDELPQLLNVLRGEMSLIGPRPLLMEYLPLYTPFERRRHEARPGITGLAQIKGRNKLSWRQRFRYDVFYVDHISFGFDLQILWGTVLNVMTGSGVTSGEARFDDIRTAKLCLAKQTKLEDAH